MAAKERQAPPATQKPQRVRKPAQEAQQLVRQESPVLKVVEELCSCLGKLEECMGWELVHPPPHPPL